MLPTQFDCSTPRTLEEIHLHQSYTFYPLNKSSLVREKGGGGGGKKKNLKKKHLIRPLPPGAWENILLRKFAPLSPLNKPFLFGGGGGGGSRNLQFETSTCTT